MPNGTEQQVPQAPILPGTEQAAQQLGIDAGQVLSAANMQAALERPTARPGDLLGIREQVRFDLGIPQLQQQTQQAFEALQQFDIGTTAGVTAIGQEVKPLELVTGEQQALQQQAALQRQSLAAQATALQSRLTAAQQEAQAQFKIRQSEIEETRGLIIGFPGAGITFGDSAETIASKLSAHSKQLEKDEEKKKLIENLQARGRSTEGLSRRELERKWKKEIKRMDREEREAAEAKALQDEREFQLKKANIESLIRSREKGTGLSPTQVKAQQDRILQDEAFSLPRGEDGFANPADIKDLLRAWTDADRSTVEFFEKLKDPITGETIFNPDDF